MKKHVTIIFLIITILLASLTQVVKAADASCSLETKSTNLEPGETFTVTFKANCEEGINAVSTKISYSEDILEIVGDVAVTDTTKWTNLGEGLQVDILHVKNDTITTADIFTVTFKVKDNAPRGNTGKITAENVFLDSDSEGNSEHELGKKDLEILVKTEAELTKIEITKAPNKTKYVEGEKFDKTGMVVTATYDDGTTREITNYTISPTENLKTTNTKITVSYEENGVAKTAEQEITVTQAKKEEAPKEEAPKEIPYTGKINYVIIIGITAVAAIVFYIMYKKYDV